MAVRADFEAIENDPITEQTLAIWQKELEAAYTFGGSDQFAHYNNVKLRIAEWQKSRDKVGLYEADRAHQIERAQTMPGRGATILTEAANPGLQKAANFDPLSILTEPMGSILTR